MLMSLFQMISKLYQKQLAYLFSRMWEGITVSLKEPLKTGYTLTLIEVQPTQANHTFGRMIQGIG